MGIFCTTTPEPNEVRLWKWYQRRERMRRGMKIKLGTGPAFYIDLFNEARRQEREEQKCRNAERRNSKQVTSRPSRLLPPPHLNQRPSYVYRLLRWLGV